MAGSERELEDLLPSRCVSCNRPVATPDQVFDFDPFEGWVTCTTCTTGDADPVHTCRNCACPFHPSRISICPNCLKPATWTPADLNTGGAR